MNDLAQLVPKSISVAFSAIGTGAPNPSFYAVNVTLLSLALPQYAGITGSPWVHTLHRYEVATYPGPSNAATLLAVATQYVKDWYLWQLARLDQQIDGYFAWTPEGMHEIEWRQAGGRITTRVIRGPFKPLEDLLLPLPIAKGSECAAREETTCIAGILVRQISYDCGTTWRVVENTGIPCGPGIPCNKIFPPITNIPPVCIGGIVYDYVQTTQDYYDSRGCLRRSISSPVLTATNICCTVCGASGPVNTGTGGICPGLPCPYCKTSTPCQWTFNLTCPDFGGSSGSGGIDTCDNCSGSTPTSWTFAGSGFTGDLAVYNVTISIPWVGEDKSGQCGWLYDGLPAGIAALITFAPDGAGGTVIDIQLSDGSTWMTYGLSVAGNPIDCCIARTLTGAATSGTGTYPATVNITPVGCGTLPNCTPNPNGAWTLTQSTKQTCQWLQYKSGVSAAISLLYDSSTGEFLLELIIVGTDYTLLFAYVTAPGQTTFDCSKAYDLALIDYDGCPCSDDPLTVTVTPVASAAACCTSGSGGSGGGTGGGGTISVGCSPNLINSQLCAKFSGVMSAYGNVTLTWNCPGGFTGTWCSIPAAHCGFINSIMSLSCQPDGTWLLQGCGVTAVMTITQLNPSLILTYTGATDAGSGCPGTFSVTITEGAC